MHFGYDRLLLVCEQNLEKLIEASAIDSPVLIEEIDALDAKCGVPSVLFDLSHSTHNGSSVRDLRYCANQDATNDFRIRLWPDVGPTLPNDNVNPLRFFEQDAVVQVDVEFRY